MSTSSIRQYSGLYTGGAKAPIPEAARPNGPLIHCRARAALQFLGQLLFADRQFKVSERDDFTTLQLGAFVDWYVFHSILGFVTLPEGHKVTALSGEVNRSTCFKQRCA